MIGRWHTALETRLLGELGGGMSDNDRALADYNEAIRLDRKNASAFRVHGNLSGGSPAEALADLDQASALDPKNAYSALWQTFITTRNNLTNRLSQLVARADMTKWPAPLVRLSTREGTPHSLQLMMRTSTRKKVRSAKQNFFSGKLALRQGANEQAARPFQLAAADCPRTFLEWEPAKADLKALGEAP